MEAILTAWWLWKRWMWMRYNRDAGWMACRRPGFSTLYSNCDVVWEKGQYRPKTVLGFGRCRLSNYALWTVPLSEEFRDHLNSP